MIKGDKQRGGGGIPSLYLSKLSLKISKSLITGTGWEERKQVDKGKKKQGRIKTFLQYNY